MTTTEWNSLLKESFGHNLVKGFQRLGYQRLSGVTDLGKKMDQHERDEIVDKVILEALTKTLALRKWAEDFKVSIRFSIKYLSCVWAKGHCGGKVGVDAHWSEKRPVREGAVGHIVCHCFRNLVNHCLKHLDWAGTSTSVGRDRSWIRVTAYPASNTTYYRLVTPKKDDPSAYTFSPLSIATGSYWHYASVDNQSWSELGAAIKAVWEVTCHLGFGGATKFDTCKIKTDVIYGLLVDDTHKYNSNAHSFIMEIVDEESFQKFLAVAAHMKLRCPHVVARVIENESDCHNYYIKWIKKHPEVFECEYCFYDTSVCVNLVS